MPIQRSKGLKRAEETAVTPWSTEWRGLYRQQLDTARLPNSDLAEALRARAEGLGFAPVGLAAVPGSPRLSLRTAALERWLAAGHQAGMAWMNDPRRRAHRGAAAGGPQRAGRGLELPRGRAAPPGSLKVARYGWGRDYHRVIDGRLRQLGRWLEQAAPGTTWRACVDSAPLLDKAWAEEAGLGWIGKNGNLIHRRRGSWMLLGHLLTSLPLPPDRPAESLCGACTACIDGLPHRRHRRALRGGCPPLHRLSHDREP